MAENRLTEDQRQARMSQILAMRADERTMDYIGRKLGITRQRVFFLIKRHEQEMIIQKGNAKNEQS